uniref:hypothetical chloroplast RF1 n=1 Tax=Klebsormidium dissectum TaxID=329816 RepID=UPI00286BED80|nr:hypothetical chloroplast RF1 [Klebsormidium dissectum]YP_010932703.1 hypothetical chloroplast RF1 [Klebsormidium dissectum]WKT06457.1 hypothetical chloroplast RF1 [Klebsormidium dissectum]WKT06458.1 hypothetical chloroplast RF1 [Klebsormidium dissectum]
MNPIYFNTYNIALYAVETIGGWFSANPTLCISAVYGFMGTQSLHVVHVIAARAFYMHGNLLGGICVIAIFIGQAVLVGMEFLGWAQPLAMRWRYNAAFITAISLSMCLVAWVIPRDPLFARYLRTDLEEAKIFEPLLELPLELTSMRDPRALLYFVFCASLYVLIPRSGASMLNDLTPILGFSHGTEPAFVWGTLLGYGIGNLFFYASLCLSRSVTCLLTKRTPYQLISPLHRVLGGMVYTVMIMQFRLDPFQKIMSGVQLKETHIQMRSVAQDRISDWVPSVAKQRLALYGRVYQVEEEMGSFNQLLLRSLVDEKNHLQSVNLLPNLCEQPTLRGNLETELGGLPPTGLWSSASSETNLNEESLSLLKGELESLMERQEEGQEVLVQHPYKKTTPQEYIEESRGFPFPWERKEPARRLGPLSLPQGQVLGSWHTYGVGLQTQKPWTTSLSPYQEESELYERPHNESNTDREQDILWPKQRFIPWWLRLYDRKEHKKYVSHYQRDQGLLPQRSSYGRAIPWNRARKRKPRWAAGSLKWMSGELFTRINELRRPKARRKIMSRRNEKFKRKRKHRSLKTRFRTMAAVPMKQQRKIERRLLQSLSTALQHPNPILLTHVPLQANSEQVRKLFDGHALERLRRIFQLWERRSTSNALLLFKERTKGWFKSEDAYQDVVQRLFSPSEALFDYCVRLMAYAQHQRAFACVLRPQTHLAWPELDKAPRLCLSVVPGLPRTRPGYQVQERIADIYVYLYGENKETRDMMNELRLPSSLKDQEKEDLVTRRLEKPQMLAILESRMLRQRARQGRRVPLRLESEGRLTPPSSLARSLHSWVEGLRTRTAGLLAKQARRRYESKPSTPLRPSRPLHSYAQGQRWGSSPDTRLPTGPPGQFSFLLVPRLLEALKPDSLQPSDRRLPFPQLRSLVQAPGLKSSRLGPRPACYRPGLLSRSMDPITTNLVATTPVPQEPGDRARRQALRKQALLSKHQGRKLEWARRKILRTLDQLDGLSVWTGPEVLESGAKTPFLPLLDPLKPLQQNLWGSFKIGRNEPRRLRWQWGDHFYQRTTLQAKGFLKRAGTEQGTAHSKSMRYQERIHSREAEALRNKTYGKVEKEVRNALSPRRPQKEEEEPLFDLQASLQSLHQVSSRTRLGPSVPWILRQALFHAKEKERVKAAWRTLYAKSGVWLGPTPSLSPLPIAISDLWHHRRTRIELQAVRHLLRGEPSKARSWSNLLEGVQKEGTSHRRPSNEISLDSALDWVGELEEKWSNLVQRRRSGVVERGYRMLFALQRSQWDKRSFLYNPMPPLLGKKLWTHGREMARLGSKKQHRMDRKEYFLPMKKKALLSSQNRENNLRLMLTHSLRLGNLRLYEQEGRKALASLAGLGPLSLFADDERVLGLVRLDDSHVHPSLRRHAWGARYRLALRRMLAKGDKHRHSTEDLRTLRRQAHRYRTWDSIAQKHISQSELSNLGFSAKHRQFERFPFALSFGEELERSQMTLGLFDTGIQSEDDAILFKKEEEETKGKRPTSSRDKQEEGKVSEITEEINPSLPMENMSSPSVLFKPESLFLSIDETLECFEYIWWGYWWDNIADSFEAETYLFGSDHWKNREIELDEHDQPSSLPFRKILRYRSHEDSRNPSRARIVAEEWLTQSSLPPGERKAYLDEQKERIEEVERRKQTVIPSLKEKSLRRDWHKRISRPVGRVNGADRWRGLISKRMHHYSIGPIARFYLEHPGLPEERALGLVPINPHIDDAEPKEASPNMPEPEVVAEMEKQPPPRLSRWALGELRSRIEADDTQEGVQKDIMRRAWERGDAASWAARSGSAPDLEAILEYEEERADEQSGTDRLHTSALDQVAIRDLYLMKRILRRLRLAFRLASLHLQSSWLKSANPQRMRRPTQFERAWAWADFWRFHGVTTSLLDPENETTLEEEENPSMAVAQTPGNSGAEYGLNGSMLEIASMKDLLDAADSLTFLDTSGGKGLPTIESLKPFKEPGSLIATVRSSFEPLAQSMDKALGVPLFVKPLFLSQRDRLRGLRARQAQLGEHRRPYKTSNQKGWVQESLEAQETQPPNGQKQVQERAPLQSWKHEAPVRQVGLSGYLGGVRRHIEWSQGHQPFLPYLRPSLGLVGPNADRPNTRTKIEEESFWTAEMLGFTQYKEFLPTYEHRSPWRQLWDDMFGRESLETRRIRRRRRTALRAGLPPRQSYRIGQGFLGIPRLVKAESSLAKGISPASLRQYKYYPTLLEPFHRNGRRKRKRMATFFDSDFDDSYGINLKKYIPRNNDSEKLFFSLSQPFLTFQCQPDWDLLRRGISFVMDLEILRESTNQLEYDLRWKDPLLVLVDKYSQTLGGLWLKNFTDIVLWFLKFNVSLIQGMFRSFAPILPTANNTAYISFMILGRPQLIYQPSNMGFFSWEQYEEKVRLDRWKKNPSFIGIRSRSSHFADHLIAVRIRSPLQAAQLALQAFVHNPWKAVNEIQMQTYRLSRIDYDHLNYYHKLHTRVYPPDNSAAGLRRYYSRFIRIRETVTKQLWRFFGITRIPYHELPYINKRIPHYLIKTYGHVPGVEPWWLGMDLQGYDWVVKAGSSHAQDSYSHPIIRDRHWLSLQREDPQRFKRMCMRANTVGRQRARGLPHYTSIKDFTFRAHLYDAEKFMKTLDRKVEILDGRKTKPNDIAYLKEQVQSELQPKENKPEIQPELLSKEPQPELSEKRGLTSYEELSDPNGLESQKEDQDELSPSGLIRRSLAIWKKLAPDPSRQRLLRRMTRIRRRALGHKLHLWVGRLWQHSSSTLQIPLPLLTKLSKGLPPNQSYTEGVGNRLKLLKQKKRDGRQFALGEERAEREAFEGLIRHELGREWSTQTHYEKPSLGRNALKTMERIESFKEKIHVLAFLSRDCWNSFFDMTRFFVLHWLKESGSLLSPSRQTRAKLSEAARRLWRQPNYAVSPAQSQWGLNKAVIGQQKNRKAGRSTLSWAEEALPSGSVVHRLVRQVQDMAHLISLRNMESMVSLAVLEGSNVLHRGSLKGQAFDEKLYSLECEKLEQTMYLVASLIEEVNAQLKRRAVTKLEKNCLEGCKRCLKRAMSSLSQSTARSYRELVLEKKDSFSLEEWATKWQSLARQRSGLGGTEDSQDQLSLFTKTPPQGEREALSLKQKSAMREKALVWHRAEVERLVRSTCSASFSRSELQRQRIVVLFQALALDIHSTEQSLQNRRALREPMSLKEGKRLWSRRDPSLREGTLGSMPVRLREAALVCLKAASKYTLSSSMEDKIDRRLRLYARHRNEMLQAHFQAQKALERALLEVPQVIERAVMGLRKSKSGLEEALHLLSLFMGMNEKEVCKEEANGAWVREEMARLMVALYDLSLPSCQLARILHQEAMSSMTVPFPPAVLHSPRETRRLHTPWGLAVRSLPKVEIPLEVEWQLRTLGKKRESLSHNKSVHDRLSLEREAKLGLLHSESSARLEKLSQQMTFNNRPEERSGIDKNPRMVDLADALAHVKKISISHTSPAQTEVSRARNGYVQQFQFMGEDYNYYRGEPWDSIIGDDTLQGNLMQYDRNNERDEEISSWGECQKEEDMRWTPEEESMYMEFLHWHAVQDIRAWRALMGNSTKALCKPVMLDIHTPLDPILFMGPVQPQGLPPRLDCPLAIETENPQMGTIRTPWLDSSQSKQDNNQLLATDLPQSLPRMKVRTLGWAMGVVQRKFVYSPPLSNHAKGDGENRLQAGTDLGRETYKGIASWQIGPVGQPIRPENKLLGTSEENRLTLHIWLYFHKISEQISQWIYQLAVRVDHAFQWLNNQIKALSVELYQPNGSGTKIGSYDRTDPFHTLAQTQPKRTNIDQPLPAKDLPVSSQESVAYAVERNKQDRLFASKALLRHMISSGNIVSSGLGHLEQEELITEKRYEHKVRHIGNRLPEPVPLEPFFSQWMDLQVSDLKGYEGSPIVARTMEISTKDLYMTSMGTFARPMAHQMSYSFHGLPERFIQKAMYSLRTWRASPTWWTTRNYFPEKPYQQTWRERLKPLRRSLRDQGFDWMVRRLDRIWRAEMLGRKAGIPQLGRIEFRKFLVKSIHSEFIRQPKQFKLWAHNKAYQLLPKSLWHLVSPSSNKSNRRNQDRPAKTLFQRLKGHVRRVQSWIMTYLQQFFNLFSPKQ